MSDDKKKYICKLPTNGYAAGDEAFLTDAEVANFNGGEEYPRFVLAEEASAADAPVEETPKEETPAAPADTTPETTPESTETTPAPGGEYVPEEKKEETPASTDSETTPPATEGVE